MKYFLALILLSGCSTTVRDRTGQTRFRTFADMKDFHYRDETTEITASIVDHSTPTKAATNGITDGITATAAAGIIAR